MATPIQQLLSRSIFATDGTTTVWDFSFSGGYLDRTHIKAFVLTPEGGQTDLVLNYDTQLIGPYQLLISPALSEGDELHIYRDTPKNLPLVDFTDGAVNSEIALDTNAKQAVFIAAESTDLVSLVRPVDLAVSVATSVAAAEAASASSASASAAAVAAGVARDEAVAASLAPTTDDLVSTAPSGLWSTVRGFITYLTGAAGSAVVGFIQSGTGAILRTLQDKGREYATFKDFGCVCDGVTNDAANFEKAIQTGRIIRMDGEAILIASPVSSTADMIIEGRGTLKFAVSAQTAITCTGSVNVTGDIVMDGTDVSNELIRASGPRLVLNVSEVKNIFQNSVDGVRPIRAIDVDYIRIFGTAFKKIATPANGTVGDSQGAVQGILISGSCKSGKVFNCSFSDINNRATAGGAKQYEDAEAVLCATSSARQNVSVFDCEFEDIGKRFMKATGTPTSIYQFGSNQLSSAYTGTVDDAVTVGNGMFSAFSCYGGRAFARDNTFIGGVIAFFFDADFTNFRSAVIADNIFEPEIHTYANTSFTRFIGVGTSVPIVASLTATGNETTNTYYGIISYATRNAITTNPRIESGGIGVDLLGGGTFTVTGNTIIQHPTWNATTTAAYGVIIRNGAVSGAGTSNAFAGKYDAWNVASQSSPCRIAFAGNSYQSIVRNDITNNAAASYVAHFANAGSTTALYSSINALTSAGASAGGGAAVPATVLGFERVLINGVSAKRPYFAV